VSSPEDALERARETAARKRADGRDAGAGLEAVGSRIAAGRPDLEDLSEWALLEVPDDTIYTTRRGGGAIVALKRALLRLLRQYHVELEGRQTRFNSVLLQHLRELEARVARLERAEDEADRASGGE